MLQCDSKEAKRGLMKGSYYKQWWVHECVCASSRFVHMGCTSSVCAGLVTSVAMLWLEPLSNKNCTTSMWFSCAAMYSGVKPFWKKENTESELQPRSRCLSLTDHLTTPLWFTLTLDATIKTFWRTRSRNVQKCIVALCSCVTLYYLKGK